MKVLHSNCHQIWKTQQWPQDWKVSVLIPIPKKGNAKECSNYCTIELISYTSKIMLKMLQARLEQYMTVNFQIFNLILEKAEKPEIQLPASTGSSESKRVAEKHIYFCLLTMPNSLTVWVTINWEIPQRMEYQTT